MPFFVNAPNALYSFAISFDYTLGLLGTKIVKNLKIMVFLAEICNFIVEKLNNDVELHKALLSLTRFYTKIPTCKGGDFQFVIVTITRFYFTWSTMALKA